jgi:hypothetical protein
MKYQRKYFFLFSLQYSKRKYIFFDIPKLQNSQLLVHATASLSLSMYVKMCFEFSGMVKLNELSKNVQSNVCKSSSAIIFTLQ